MKPKSIESHCQVALDKTTMISRRFRSRSRFQKVVFPWYSLVLCLVNTPSLSKSTASTRNDVAEITIFGEIWWNQPIYFSLWSHLFWRPSTKKRMESLLCRSHPWHLILFLGPELLLRPLLLALRIRSFGWKMWDIPHENVQFFWETRSKMETPISAKNRSWSDFRVFPIVFPFISERWNMVFFSHIRTCKMGWLCK